MSHSWSKFKYVNTSSCQKFIAWHDYSAASAVKSAKWIGENIPKHLQIAYNHIHFPLFQRSQDTTRWSRLQSHLPANPYVRHHRSSAWFAVHWSNLCIPGSWNCHFHHPSRSWCCWPLYRSPGSWRPWSGGNGYSLVTWQWNIPCGNLLHSYGTWPFIVSFPIKRGVELPEGSRRYICLVFSHSNLNF